MGRCFFIICLCLGPAAQAAVKDPTDLGKHPLLSHTWHLLLKARSVTGGLAIDAVPQILTDKQPPVHGPFMTRPIQASVALLGMEVRAMKPVTVPFTLTVKNLEGAHIGQLTWVVRMWRNERKEYMDMDILFGNEVFSAKKLSTTQDFDEVLKAMMTPLSYVLLPEPEAPYFLLELRFDSIYRGDNIPKYRKDRDAVFPLGTAYCERKDDTLHVFSNIHIRLFEQARTVLDRVALAAQADQEAAVIEGLRYHLDQVPSNREAARNLLTLYRARDPEKAVALAADFQPYFARWYFRDPYRSALATNQNTINRIRRKFKAEPESFPKAEDGWLDILEPADNDLVSGRFRVTFAVNRKNLDNPILRVLCYAGDRLVAQRDEAPNFFDLNASGNGTYKVRVVACFLDGSRLEDTITLKSLTTDAGQKVDLGEMQVVALDANDMPTDLPTEHLRLSYLGAPIEVERVRRDTQPLDVVVLIDTSGSMENRIYQAQFAVFGFLEKMREKEAASVYSYDEKVVLVKRFENDLDEAAPRLFSLMPMGSTALYDALLVARCKLMARPDSTKAIIVIGDGKDTASLTGSEELMHMFEGTPIRVYAIQHWTYGTTREKKWPVLGSLAEKTGGLFYKLNDGEHPEKVLERILAELRRLYFVNYQAGGLPAEAEIKAEAAGLRLRHLQVRRY